MTHDDPLLPTLGFLRTALLLLALVNLIPPLIDLLAGTPDGQAWEVVIGIMAPVMAPLIMVVLLFDYIMSRVRAADAEAAEREQFTRICRIELGALGLTLLVWVPFFVTRFG